MQGLRIYIWFNKVENLHIYCYMTPSIGVSEKSIWSKWANEFT